MRTKVLVALIGAALLIAPVAAHANPAMVPREMERALPLANTPFKQCVVQQGLQTNQHIVLTDADVTTGRAALNLGEQNLTRRLMGNFAAPQQQEQNNWAAALSGQGNQQQQVLRPGLNFSQGFGYTGQAQSWLQLFNAGDARRAAVMMAHGEASQRLIGLRTRRDPTRLTDDALARDVGVLGLLERGMVSMSLGDVECAANFYDFAIDRSELQQGSFWGSDLEGYEHIMALDMKAIAYLLGGDRRARNMIQQSRELQGQARDEYAAQLEQMAQQAQQQSASEGMPNQDVWLGQFSSGFQGSALSGNAQIAQRVASPYVNPLPDYMSAVIAEIEATSGTGTRDEWSRATIAWRAASTLAPGTPFLAEAARQADAWNRRGGPPAGMRVVHVLVGVGGAPNRAVASMQFSYENRPFPVRIPVVVSQPSGVIPGNATARVGNVSARLQLVSDIEGMAIRQAEDERPSEMLAALVRGWIAYRAGLALNSDSNNILTAALGGAVRDSLAEPSTNAWLSLPAQYYAARLVAPASATEVTIDVPGAGVQTLALSGQASTFIYATAKDNQLWGVAQQAAFGSRELTFQVQ